MKHTERGSTMAETAISMSLTLAVFLGIIYFGMYLYTFHALSNAARLGSRYAMVRGSACTVTGCPATAATIQDYVRAQTPILNRGTMTVTTTWSSTPTGSCSGSGTNAPHNIVCVAVSYPFTFSLPLVPSPALTLSSRSQMVITQ